MKKGKGHYFKSKIDLFADIAEKYLEVLNKCLPVLCKGMKIFKLKFHYYTLNL